MKHYTNSPFTGDDTLGLWLMQEKPEDITKMIVEELGRKGYCIKEV